MIVLPSNPVHAKIKFGTGWISGHHNAESGTTLLPGDMPQLRFEVTKDAEDAEFGTLVADTVTISGSFYARMKQGVVAGYDIGHVILRGNNVKNFGRRGESSWATRGHISGSFSYEIATLDLPTSIQQGIIAACNSPEMSSGRSLFDFPIHMQLKARRFLRGDTRLNPKADKRFDGVVRAMVFCTTFTHNVAPPRPLSVNLRLKHSGGQCPRLVTARTTIRYDRPTVARFNIVHNGKKRGPIAIKARKLASPDGAEYIVVREETFIAPAGQSLFQTIVKNGGRSDIKTLNVVCPSFKISSANLRYDMVNNGQCPRDVWETATFRTNGPGKFVYQIEHSGGLILFEEEIEAKLFDDQYKAVAQRFMQLSAKDMELRARAKNVTDPSSYSAWVPLKITCEKDDDDKGPGSLADPQLPDPDGPKQSWTGTLTIADSSGRADRCPRPGQIFFEARRKQAGPFKYRIGCSNGASLRASSQVFSTGSDFKAFGTHPLRIDRTRKIRCSLQEIRPGGKRVTIAKSQKSFVCANRTPGAEDASGGLTSAGDPSHSAEQEISCRGGKVRGDKCFCGPSKKRQALSRTSFVCKAKPRKISCRGGKVRDNKCFCGPNKKRQALGRISFVCKARSRKISCRGGKVRDSKCFCGPNKKRQRIGSKAFVCRKKARNIRCIGGKVRGGRCKCPRKRPTYVRGRCIRPAG